MATPIALTADERSDLTALNARKSEARNAASAWPV
jgi:hypothetical protein